MYTALKPLRDNITVAQLPNYFKTEALDPGNTIVRTETISGHAGCRDPPGHLRRPAHLRANRRLLTFGAG